MPPDEEEKPAFIDRNSVTSFFAIAVLVNAMFLGLDVQMRASKAGAGWTTFMQITEMGFLVVFTLELVLRICADRCPKFLWDGWNLMDVVLVGSSMMDFIFQTVFGSEEGGDLNKLRLIRILKVTRLVRAVRIFRVLRFKWILRAVRGLILLCYAIVSALKALGWVIFMFAMINYLFSIITTEFLGLANDQEDPLIQEWFGDMFSSMFTLIEMATLQNWTNITRHVATGYGNIWILFFTIYVMVTNLIILNVVLATLIENVISLNEEVKDAHNGDLPSDEIEDWMLTPPDSDEDDEEEDDAGADDAASPRGGGGGGFGGGLGGGPQVNMADRLAMQSLSEFFDLASTYVGIEGVNQRKLVTVAGLANALDREEVKTKLFTVCPAMKDVEPQEMSEKIWASCPKRLDREGLSRQELAEACMVVRGELSMNHFVVISQALQQLEKHVDHELVHLNKHQRKMNRRFLKMRHRLRKVYHFDGAPRKLVEMVNEMKRKNIQAAAEAAARGEKIVVPNGMQEGEDASDVALSEGTDDSQDAEQW